MIQKDDNYSFILIYDGTHQEGGDQTFCDDGEGVLRMWHYINAFILILPHWIILREHEWNILNILSF